MLKIAQPEVGDVMETEYMHGGYRLKIAWHYGTDVAQVSMYDLSERLPLRWSSTMTKARANGVKMLFENIGYFDLMM